MDWRPLPRANSFLALEFSLLRREVNEVGGGEVDKDELGREGWGPRRTYG